MDGPLGQKSKKWFRSAFGSNKNKKIIFWNLLTFRINQIYQITDSIVNIVLKFECPLWNSNLELLTTTSVLWFSALDKKQTKKVIQNLYEACQNSDSNGKRLLWIQLIRITMPWSKVLFWLSNIIRSNQNHMLNWLKYSIQNSNCK